MPYNKSFKLSYMLKFLPFICYCTTSIFRLHCVKNKISLKIKEIKTYQKPYLEIVSVKKSTERLQSNKQILRNRLSSQRLLLQGLYSVLVQKEAP